MSLPKKNFAMEMENLLAWVSCPEKIKRMVRIEAEKGKKTLDIYTFLTIPACRPYSVLDLEQITKGTGLIIEKRSFSTRISWEAYKIYNDDDWWDRDE